MTEDRSKSPFQSLSRVAPRPLERGHSPADGLARTQKVGLSQTPSSEDVVLDGFPREVSSFGGPIEEVLREIRLDFHSPNVFDVRFQVLAEKKRHPDFVVWIADLMIYTLQSLDETLGRETPFLLVAIEKVVVGRKLPKSKPAAQRMIDQGDRSIGSVHGSEQTD